MTDDRIRSEIRTILPRLTKSWGESQLVEEMEICSGAARADLALLGKYLVGIEIKGPNDSLRRLAQQATSYSRCFEFVILVVENRMVDEANKIVPPWWGIVCREATASEYSKYAFLRRPRRNPAIEVDALLSLLWKEEMTLLVCQASDDPPNERLTKRALKKVIAERFGLQELTHHCLCMLRNRQGWRSVQI